ncbi:hypothetical protein M513_12140 [Trichuris suis]|uniref:Uncharacterized protein n=1 Tax=Trichuris suis TaxID=68888 RepID=A0A085LPQ4_9BILA|nr:hypothetical protein M513_12140 [Trichuris suis]
MRNGHERSNEFFEQLTKSMITSVSQLASQLSAGLGQLHIDMNSLKSSLMSATGGPKAPTRRSDDSRQEGIEIGQPEAVRLKKVGQLATERARSEFVANEDCAFPQAMGTEVIRADDWIETRSTTNIQSPDAASTNRVPMGTQPLILSVAIEPFDGDPRNWETFIGNLKALVHDVIPSDTQRMAILLQLLCPRIRNSIASSFHSPNMYAQTSSDPRRLFGDRNAIIDTHIRSLLNIAPMKGPGKNEAERFFFDVHRAVGALRVKGAEEELRSRATLQTVASRLNRKM